MNQTKTTCCTLTYHKTKSNALTILNIVTNPKIPETDTLGHPAKHSSVNASLLTTIANSR